MIRKTMALLTALALLAACLTGCAGKSGQERLPGFTEPARGRYVETELPLPENAGQGYDLVLLPDGRLRVGMDGGIFTSDPARSSWEDSIALPEVSDAGYMESLALSATGEAFCSILETGEDGTAVPHLWAMTPEGSWQELSWDYPGFDPEMGFFINDAVFAPDGRLYVACSLEGVHLLDLETGTFGPDLNDTGSMVWSLEATASGLYLISSNQEQVTFFSGGETKALPEVVDAQFSDSLHQTIGMDDRLTLWENQEGYLFFTTHQGLYSALPEATVTEELVSGSRSSLGSPMFTPIALTGSDEGSFYLLGYQKEGPVLLVYTYDENALVAPEKTVRIFTLSENDSLREIISRFQKANPDYLVELEIGVPAESGITDADAIRTLNTEILAGNGPDVILLDGLNIATYQEKGLLADLSPVLDQAGPLVDTVARCYGEDGKVWAVPAAFSLPVIYGERAYLAQATDLASLAAAGQALRQARPEQRTAINGYYPKMVAEILYDGCSAAWVNADGTLNQQALTAFYQGLQQVYDLDADVRSQNPELMAAMAESYDQDFSAGFYTGLTGAYAIFSGSCLISAGTLDGMERWSYALAGEDRYLSDDYGTFCFAGQAPGSFLPRMVLGILTTAQEPEGAEQFLAYVLSQQIQSQCLYEGFPVNRTVLDHQLADDGSSLQMTTFASSDGSGQMLEYAAQWPSPEDRQTLKGWLENLTVPALTNRIIRQAVLEQTVPCCNGEITPDQAAANAIQALNLYLAE